MGCELAHSQQRSEMDHAQVFPHLMIGVNRLTVIEFGFAELDLLDIESRQKAAQLASSVHCSFTN